MFTVSSNKASYNKANFVEQYFFFGKFYIEKCDLGGGDEWRVRERGPPRPHRQIHARLPSPQEQT